MQDTDQLDAAFAALANPTRRTILVRLAQGEATVNDLAAPFDMSLPAVSKHIRVLEDAGLITRGKTAQFRPCTLNLSRLLLTGRINTAISGIRALTRWAVSSKL